MSDRLGAVLREQEEGAIGKVIDALGVVKRGLDEETMGEMAE